MGGRAAAGSGWAWFKKSDHVHIGLYFAHSALICPVNGPRMWESMHILYPALSCRGRSLPSTSPFGLIPLVLQGGRIRYDVRTHVMQDEGTQACGLDADDLVFFFVPATTCLYTSYLLTTAYLAGLAAVAVPKWSRVCAVALGGAPDSNSVSE